MRHSVVICPTCSAEIHVTPHAVVKAAIMAAMETLNTIRVPVMEDHLERAGLFIVPGAVGRVLQELQRRGKLRRVSHRLGEYRVVH